MTKNINRKIYSIQIDLDNEKLVEIETIILNGLYRFSILGINNKNSSDMKDRIYSALRSQKLINLKSDNRKITVNILQLNTVDKNIAIYDLGIALSCLNCLNKINIEEDIIVVGELSILGNILFTGHILKTIYQTIESGLKTIVCSQYDIETININDSGLIDLIEKNNIKFICSNTLNDLIEKISNNTYYIHKNKVSLIEKDRISSVKILNTEILKIILSICTNRSVFIEDTKGSYIRKFINNLSYYSQKLNAYELIKIANILNKDDLEILNNFNYPIVSIVHDQMAKNDLIETLTESFFGFNIINNFSNLTEETFYTIKKYRKSCIVGFYKVCPCGNGLVFFNKNENEKCFCLQRNIIRHKQKIQRFEDGFFDFHIKDIESLDLDSFYSENDYININKLISDFRNTAVEVFINDELVNVFKNKGFINDQKQLDQVISLTKDVYKINYLILKNKVLPLSLSDMENSLNLIKKDF